MYSSLRKIHIAVCVVLLLFFSTQSIGTSTYPDLHQAVNQQLQKQLEQYVKNNGLTKLANKKQLSFALVDITNPEHPQVGAINGDVNLYAASLPKIAIYVGRELEHVSQVGTAQEDERQPHDL